MALMPFIVTTRWHKASGRHPLSAPYVGLRPPTGTDNGFKVLPTTDATKEGCQPWPPTTGTKNGYQHVRVQERNTWYQTMGTKHEKGHELAESNIN